MFQDEESDMEIVFIVELTQDETSIPKRVSTTEFMESLKMAKTVECQARGEKAQDCFLYAILVATRNASFLCATVGLWCTAI